MVPGVSPHLPYSQPCPGAAMRPGSPGADCLAPYPHPPLPRPVRPSPPAARCRVALQVASAMQVRHQARRGQGQQQQQRQGALGPCQGAMPRGRAEEPSQARAGQGGVVAAVYTVCSDVDLQMLIIQWLVVVDYCSVMRQTCCLVKTAGWCGLALHELDPPLLHRGLTSAAVWLDGEARAWVSSAALAAPATDPLLLLLEPGTRNQDATCPLLVGATAQVDAYEDCVRPGHGSLTVCYCLS
ncbi:hypothetical protein HaLaN_00926 [Haematococcus lacustris]|uniref:Uncharacterized protein n=1 Tax=Haematococcus lacustris TaxID=44745 RepID=A0A699YH11_HAELA|nr:hypothetical protein HaLaN_00926 [Haematococcus lacustris]